MSGAHPLGERSAGVAARLEESVPVDSFAGKVEVRWAPEEAVTPQGQLPFFVDFLKQADLFDPFVRQAPLQYTSPNAPRVRDVLGTLLLSVVSGASRYAHVNALRYDGVNPGLLGMSRVCSDDTVRRAIACDISGSRSDVPSGQTSCGLRPDSSARTTLPRTSLRLKPRGFHHPWKGH